jgi:hypothetical protein
MKRILILLVATTAALAGCASTPSKITGSGANTNLAAAAPALPITNPTIVTDLQSAAFNLDNAVAVGALSANDPAPKCLHGILQQAGIETPPGATAPQSFVPKNDGVASLGAIAYIQVQQAKRFAGTGVSVPVDCKALLGQFVLDGMSGAAKVAPIVPGLRLLPALN